MGVLGVLCRWGADGAAVAWLGLQPWIGTLLVNVVGCALAGYLAGYEGLRADHLTHLRQGLLVGFTGGFTTFSAFSMHIVHMLEQGQLLQALGYGLVSPVAGVASATVAFSLARGAWF